MNGNREKLIDIMQELILELYEEEYDEETWKERAADALIAAGVICPKFKAGQDIWFISGDKDPFVRCETIRAIYIHFDGGIAYVYHDCGNEHAKHLQYSIDEKYAYATEAEAQAALTASGQKKK